MCDFFFQNQTTYIIRQKTWSAILLTAALRHSFLSCLIFCFTQPLSVQLYEWNVFFTFKKDFAQPSRIFVFLAQVLIHIFTFYLALIFSRSDGLGNLIMIMIVFCQFPHYCVNLDHELKLAKLYLWESYRPKLQKFILKPFKQRLRRFFFVAYMSQKKITV